MCHRVIILGLYVQNARIILWVLDVEKLQADYLLVVPPSLQQYIVDQWFQNILAQDPKEK